MGDTVRWSAHKISSERYVSAVCGRFTLTSSTRKVFLHFASKSSVNFRPRFNISPGQEVVIVRSDSLRDERVLERRTWGLASQWSSDPKRSHRVINIRSETAGIRSIFRESLAQRRCLIPADGFYEWSNVDSDFVSAYYVQNLSRSLFGFAGIYDHWVGPNGEANETCGILTTPARGPISELHKRMPLVMRPSLYSDWLSQERMGSDELEDVVDRAETDWKFRRVGSRVNSTQNDDPRCIQFDREPRTLDLFPR